MTGKTLLLYALTVIHSTVNKKRITLNVGDELPEGIPAADLEYLKKNGKVSETKPRAAQVKAAPQPGDETLNKALKDAENEIKTLEGVAVDLQTERDDALAEVARLQQALAEKASSGAPVDTPPETPLETSGEPAADTPTEAPAESTKATSKKGGK